jgi:hypothetical protein
MPDLSFSFAEPSMKGMRRSEENMESRIPAGNQDHHQLFAMLSGSSCVLRQMPRITPGA